MLRWKGVLLVWRCAIHYNQPDKDLSDDKDHDADDDLWTHAEDPIIGFVDKFCVHAQVPKNLCQGDDVWPGDYSEAPSSDPAAGGFSASPCSFFFARMSFSRYS